MHQSVLLQEVLQSFEGRTLSTFVDGTLGAGGHAHAILTAHPEITRFIGIDQDPQALGMSKEKLADFKDKVTFVPANFASISQHADQVDGILVDLGVSSMQFDQPEKGFSFMRDGPLDMRMNPSDPLSAKEIINHWDIRDIGRIFKVYGDEKRWRRAAETIGIERKKAPIETTLQLVQILEPVLRDYKQKIHPLTKVFQALRIAVNRELEVLESFLQQAIKILKPGGRLAVISFHSGEDRIVKHFFRDRASDKVNTWGLGDGVFIDKDPEIKILTTRPLEASDEEVEENPRSRSAKLRVVEKV